MIERKEGDSIQDTLQVRRQVLLRKLARVERKIDRSEERLARIARRFEVLKRDQNGL